MATDFDPYRILQVPTDASDDEIRAAYERAATSATNGGGVAELRDVETAYRLLGDPAQRQAYDQRHAEAIARGYTEVDPQAGEEALCGQCGAELLASQSFCTTCGAEVSPSKEGRRYAVPWGFLDICKAIMVIVGGLIVVGIPVYVLADALAGSEAIEDDPNAWTLVLVSNFSVQFLMFGGAYWFSVRKYRLNWSALGFRRPDRGGVLFTIGLIFAAYAVVFAWGAILALLGVETDTDLPEQTYEDLRPIIALVVLSIFLAPIAEETFFRGFVFGALRPRWGWVLAAIASAALFSLAHVGNTGYLPVLPSIVGIGVVFAWGYHWSGSIYPPMFAHFAFNTLSVILAIASA
jgi:membrane protease YdiL (CAAX protease family)